MHALAAAIAAPGVRLLHSLARLQLAAAAHVGWAGNLVKMVASLMFGDDVSAMREAEDMQEMGAPASDSMYYLFDKATDFTQPAFILT